MKRPHIQIKLIVSKKDGKLSIRMKGFNFQEVADAKDLPEDQRVLWETALNMLHAATESTNEVDSSP